MKKVVIGLSGGVDSAVGAYLLKKEGYEVIGLFMRNWDSNINNDILGNPNDTNDICPQEKDYNDAKKVCEFLGIELHRIDFIKEYWDYVFTYFLEELKKGRTPNPDMLCNKYIKFDLFVKEARRLGADYIATGHYARIKGNKLLRAKDLNKNLLTRVYLRLFCFAVLKRGEVLAVFYLLLIAVRPKAGKNVSKNHYQ